jgi:hypothetical protein
MRIECTLLGGKLYILKAPFIHVDNNIKPLNSNQVPIAATTTPQISSMDLETNAFPAPAVSLSKVPVDVGVKVVSKAKSILGLKLILESKSMPSSIQCPRSCSYYPRCYRCISLSTKIQYPYSCLACPNYCQ